MKKLFLISSILTLGFSLLTAKIVSAVGEECKSKGGNCANPYTGCPSGTKEWFIADCGEEADPYSGSYNPIPCCIPGTTGCKDPFYPCSENEECCSGNCEYSAHHGEKLCLSPEKPPDKIKDICVDVPEGKSKDACEDCFVAGNTWTALGCIPTNDLNNFIGWLLGRLIFVVTGIAFLLLVVGAFQILTSAGNPEKVKAGGELITSTLAGLLLIILSLFLLKLIGVDILHIPGF